MHEALFDSTFWILTAICTDNDWCLLKHWALFNHFNECIRLIAKTALILKSPLPPRYPHLFVYQEVKLFFHPFNLGWSCDLLWTTKCNRVDSVLVLSVGLKEPYAPSLSLFKLYYYLVNKLGLSVEDEIHGEERPVVLAKAILGQSILADSQTCMRAAYPIYNWLQIQEWDQITLTETLRCLTDSNNNICLLFSHWILNGLFHSDS